MKPITTILRDNKGLSRTALEQSIPSIFATHPHPEVSEHYEFIPTHEVLETLEASKFRCVFATQQATGSGVKEFKRHMLRFRHNDFKTHEVGETVPEVCLVNSHDRTSRYVLSAGLWRKVCSNGLMVADPRIPSSMIRILHLNKQATKDAIIKASEDIIQGVGLLSNRIVEMTQTKLDIGQQLEFAAKALELRYGAHPPTISTDAILKARRPQDEGEDIWRTMNRIQENFTHGTSEGKHQSKPLTSLAESIKINQGLWRLAAQYCDASKN